MVLAVLVISLFFLMAIGVPIVWSLGISGFFALLLIDVPLFIVPQKVYYGIDIFTLICIPFFILTGEIMAKVGLTRRLLDFAIMLVGFIRGGLALANVVASMFFGGITGSAMADASALGPIEIRMMVDNGYGRTSSAAITSASACIGPIIPPSIPVVLYAMSARGVSVAALFAAGLITAIVMIILGTPPAEATIRRSTGSWPTAGPGSEAWPSWSSTGWPARSTNKPTWPSACA